MNRFIVGFGKNEHEYMINGVRYIVENRYEPVNFQHMDKNTRIDHRLESYITGDFAELTLPPPSDTMKAESVCSAAGREVNNAAEKEE